ncbi:MAG: 30S ribosomal protein S6 [Deltaproteobacteria bacterium]|nr:30S ribosomal protein S6 [Deltaproteobacteria bacterium]NIS77462.1 30S ribosomal protein S6 [Deltaproteobacteria bacterium]
MNRYETGLIFDLDMEEEERSLFVERLEKIIGDFSGEVFDREDWGVRRLAYRILKKSSGHYLFLRYNGERGVVEELERVMGLNERILRYLTTRFEKDIKGKYPIPPSIDEFLDRDITELQTLRAQWRRGAAAPSGADQKGEEKEDRVKKTEEKEVQVKKAEEEEAQVKKAEEEEAQVKKAEEEEAQVKKAEEEDAQVKKAEEEEAQVKKVEEEEAQREVKPRAADEPEAKRGEENGNDEE